MAAALSRPLELTVLGDGSEREIESAFVDFAEEKPGPDKRPLRHSVTSRSNSWISFSSCLISASISSNGRGGL